MRADSASLESKILVPLLLIVLLAGWIRIDYAVSQMDGVFTKKDAGVYLNYGINLYRSRTFSMMDPGSTLVPDSFRSPGYPLLIALTMAIGGEAGFLPILLVIQAVLSTLLVPLTFFLGCFFLPAVAALIAAFLVALSPHLITITGYLLTETLFAFFLLAALYVLQRARASEGPGMAVLGGLLFGVAYLANEAVLFLPYILIAVIALNEKRVRKAVSKKWIAHMIVLVSVFSLFPIAWTLRNQVRVPPEAEKGMDRALITMSHGAYPDFIYKNPLNRVYPYRDDPEQPEFGTSLDVFFRVLGDRIQEEPLRYLRWYTVGKPYTLWSWDIIQGMGDIYIYPVREGGFHHSRSIRAIHAIMKTIHPFLIFSAFLCLPLLLVQHPAGHPQTGPRPLPILPLTVCLYFTALYTVFAPWPRYGIPLRPEFYLCALWAIVSVFERFRAFAPARRTG